MLKLSDADLARLRLEALKAMGGVWPEIQKQADEIVAWCLRDRDPDGTDS